MDSGKGPWASPHYGLPMARQKRDLQDSQLFKAVFVITFLIAFIFLIISIYALFHPVHASDYSQPSPVYFFLLLLISPIYQVSTLWLNAVMVVLYSIFFLSMLYLGVKRWNGRAIDNPMVYYGAMVSFGLVMSLAITIIESAFGVSVGGTSIETGIQQHPYLSYVQLIYAPFAEELGFRIIPLGLLTVFLVIRNRGTAWDRIASFAAPGIVRRKYGIKLGKADYTLIIITSFIFGLAHFLSGAWDPGKIVSATLVGFILAFGYIKFGIFVDIPMHWFFNGFSTVPIIYAQMTDPWAVALMWSILSGVVGFLFLILLAVERNNRRDGGASVPPDSFA